MSRHCPYGRIPYEAVNEGAESMIKDIAKRAPDAIVAYTEFKLQKPVVGVWPNITPNVFEWNNIKKINWNDQVWKLLTMKTFPQ